MNQIVGYILLGGIIALFLFVWLMMYIPDTEGDEERAQAYAAWQQEQATEKQKQEQFREDIHVIREHIEEQAGSKVE